MKGQESNYIYYEDLSCKAVQLDYRDELIKALIIQPIESLDEYLNRFSSFELNHFVSSMKRQSLSFVMSEFEVELKTELNDKLSSMGMNKAFKLNEGNFSYLFEQQSSCIETVIHQTI